MPYMQPRKDTDRLFVPEYMSYFRIRPADTIGPQNGAAALPTPGRPPKHSVKTVASPNIGNKPYSGSTLGPSSHVKPFSQSYGVGLTAGVIAGGWLADAGVVGEPGVGDGGAKRGEYEVRTRGMVQSDCPRHRRMLCGTFTADFLSAFIGRT